jgi:hypothetical protein
MKAILFWIGGRARHEPRKCHPRKRCAGIQRQKGMASTEELLPIADQAATHVDRPHIDHADLLYDENGLPASSERPLNPKNARGFSAGCAKLIGANRKQ